MRFNVFCRTFAKVRVKRNVLSLYSKSYCQYSGQTDSYKLVNEIVHGSRLPDEKFMSELENNLKYRKGAPNLNELTNAWQSYKDSKNSTYKGDQEKAKLNLQQQFFHLPNTMCASSLKLKEPKIIEEFGDKFHIENVLPLEKLTHYGIYTDSTRYNGDKSYYLRGSMAKLEQKLIRYVCRKLLAKGFRQMAVPDVLSREVLRRCGVPLLDTRTMVYSLDTPHDNADSQLCLSGTAEMGFGLWLQGRRFTLDQLPLRLFAVSRCYRAETSKVEPGIFRVHNFSKVEMYGVTAAGESARLYQEFVEVQKEILQELGLTARVLLMPPCELGNPAHAKTDIEAWLPGRGTWGELTSASDCTNYQSGRLGAAYVDERGTERLVNTVNGTGVAVPRTIIALCETHQQSGGRKALRLPQVLGVPVRRMEGDEPEISNGVTVEKIMVFNEQFKANEMRYQNSLDL